MSDQLPATTQVKPPVVSGPRGLQLETLDDMWRFSECLVRSGLAPKGVATQEAIVIALQMGAELGLPPMASIQNVAVINGRPSVWGDAQLAVCQASPAFDHSAFLEELRDMNGEFTATCTVRRLPNGNPVTRQFSMNDAKKASLAGKQGPWQQYPKRMLQMRARSWALRDAFPAELRGFITTEEARDLPAETPETTPLPPPKSLADLSQKIESEKPKRKSKAKAKAVAVHDPPVEQTAEQADPLMLYQERITKARDVQTVDTIIEDATQDQALTEGDIVDVEFAARGRRVELEAK